ncbi:MAG TPA: hypothetical protein VH643_23395 [Gemmataceae bacterium]|jgi:hypothetical protein
MERNHDKDRMPDEEGPAEKRGISRYLILLLGAGAVIVTGLAVWKGVHNVLVERHIAETTQAIAALEALGGKFGVEDKGLEVKSSSSVTFGWAARITDADMSHFEKLPNLCAINLNHTRIGADGLVHLKGLGKLHTLDLMNTQVSDVGLAHLKGLTSLQDLDLEGTQVTDEGMEHLSKLKLRSLNFARTKVTDAGLRQLAGHSQLQVLGLDKTEITDAGLEHLKRLANLKVLSVKETKITDAGIKDLQRTLPNARIHR